MPYYACLVWASSVNHVLRYRRHKDLTFIGHFRELSKNEKKSTKAKITDLASLLTRANKNWGVDKFWQVWIFLYLSKKYSSKKIELNNVGIVIAKLLAIQQIASCNVVALNYTLKYMV